MQISLLFDCLMSLLVTKCCIFLSPSSPFFFFFFSPHIRFSFSCHNYFAFIFFSASQQKKNTNNIKKKSTTTVDIQSVCVIVIIKWVWVFIQIALCLIFGVFAGMTRCRKTWSSEFNISHLSLTIGYHNANSLAVRGRNFRFFFSLHTRTQQ